MESEIQAYSSSNWNDGDAGSKRIHATIDRRKVTMVVHSAIHLTLRMLASLSSRNARISAAPISGSRSRPDKQPGHQRAPPNIDQVTSAATPRSIAKA